MEARGASRLVVLLALVATAAACSDAPTDLSRRVEPVSVETTTAPVSARNLGTGGQIRVTTCTTPAITPARGEVILAWVASLASQQTTPPVPRLSGASTNWMLVDTTPAIGTTGQRRLSLFFAHARGPGQVSISMGTPGACQWSFLAVSGLDLSRPLVQRAHESRVTWSTTGQVALAPFARSIHPTVAGFIYGRTTVGYPEMGFRLMGHHAVSAPSASIVTEFRPSADQTAQFSWDAPGHWRGIAVELRRAVSS
jgi:hypothetical protein